MIFSIALMESEIRGFNLLAYLTGWIFFLGPFVLVSILIRKTWIWLVGAVISISFLILIGRNHEVLVQNNDINENLGIRYETIDTRLFWTNRTIEQWIDAFDLKSGDFLWSHRGPVITVGEKTIRHGICTVDHPPRFTGNRKEVYYWLDEEVSKKTYLENEFKNRRGDVIAQN